MSYLKDSPDENQLLKMRNYWQFIFRKKSNIEKCKYLKVYWSIWLDFVFSYVALILAIEVMNSRELQWSCGSNIPVATENIQNINLIFFFRMYSEVTEMEKPFFAIAPAAILIFLSCCRQCEISIFYKDLIWSVSTEHIWVSQSSNHVKSHAYMSICWAMPNLLQMEGVVDGRIMQESSMQQKEQEEPWGKKIQAARERLQGETGLSSATWLDKSNIKREEEQFITERTIGRIKGIDKALFLFFFFLSFSLQNSPQYRGKYFWDTWTQEIRIKWRLGSHIWDFLTYDRLTGNKFL